MHPYGAQQKPVWHMAYVVLQVPLTQRVVSQPTGTAAWGTPMTPPKQSLSFKHCEQPFAPQ